MTRLRAALAATILIAAAAILLLAMPDTETLRSGDLSFSVRDVQLNTFTKSLQECVTLGMDSGGEILAAWESRRQEAGTYGVFARRIDEKGIAHGGEIHVNQTLAGHQSRPVVAIGDEGEYLAWNSSGQPGQRVVVVGRELGNCESALSRGAGVHELGSMALLPGGGSLLAWTSHSERGGSQVVVRILNSDGSPAGEEILVSQGEMAIDRLPALSVHEDGFRVAWSREIPGAGTVGVLSRAFDLSGQALGDERLLVTGGIEPSLSCAHDGHFALAWMSAGDDAYIAAARLFDADGEAMGDAFKLDDTHHAQSGVAISMRDDGSFAAAWNRLERDIEETDVFARIYDSSGTPLGEAFRATASSEGRQMLAVANGAQRLVYGNDGRLALAWTGEGTGGDKSAANVSLLLREAGISERFAWAMDDLSSKLRPAPESEPIAIAQPHTPPVYVDPGEPIYEAELSFAGDPLRDEGFRLFSSTGWTPPDPHAAVGPDHVVGTVNGGINCYTKDGTSLWQVTISGGGGFWGPLGANSFVFDPEAIYDPHSGRFMAMACERSDNNRSYFDFAVSADSSPTNSTSEWHKYRIDVTSWSGNDIDSPNMAVTDDAIYLTADFFGPDKYGILIIDKSSVLSGGAAVTTHYLHTGTQSQGLPVNYDAGGAMYMLEDAENTSSSSLKIYAIQNPLGSPSLVSTTFPVDTYWYPIDVRSDGTSASIETFESRFWSCVVRNGKLWATHHVCPTSARNSLAARWYEIDLNGWPGGGTPFVVQSGDILPNGSGYTSFCSISVNAFGQAAVNFTYSSLNHYLDMYRVMRNTTDTPGTMQSPVLLKATSSAYTGGRWGDYSSIAVDPVDNRSFWSHGEYSPGGNSWSTWISSFDPGEGTGADFPQHALKAGGVWPNPTSGESRFAFELPSGANVSMDIFDVRGRRVRSLDGGEFGEGHGHLIWDGRDSRGTEQPAGVYFARFNIGGRQLPGGSVTLVR